MTIKPSASVGRHTPTPWVHEIDGDCHAITNTLGHDVAWVEGIFNKADAEKNAANAAFIVQAVNVHDELVEALEAALPICNLFNNDVVTRQVRAALAKVQP